MKKLISIALMFTTTVTLTVGSALVFAQDKPAITSSADSVSNEKNFQERKKNVLQHINDMITKMQQVQNCVQAANDFNTMTACRPHENDKNGRK